jgi:hypothetical protein
MSSLYCTFMLVIQSMDPAGRRTDHSFPGAQNCHQFTALHAMRPMGTCLEHLNLAFHFGLRPLTPVDIKNTPGGTWLATKQLIRFSPGVIHELDY